MSPDIPRTTREGFPNLWGQGEMHDYAVAVATELGKMPPRRGRSWTWDRLPGFPEPVARLQCGNVWLASELIPWIENRISNQSDSPHSTAPVPAFIRAGILADRGNASQRKIAAKYGVGATTVRNIWNESDASTEKGTP